MRAMVALGAWLHCQMCAIVVLDGICMGFGAAPAAISKVSDCTFQYHLMDFLDFLLDVNMY